MSTKVINPMDAIVSALSNFSTGVLWDVMRVMGLPHQALHHTIRPLESTMTLCGPAFCVKGQTWLGSLPKPDPVAPQPKYELFNHLYDGCVMLVDSGCYEEAVLMGENFAISAMGAGCKGFVLDGAIRDAAGFVERDIPMFNRFLTPASSAGRWSITDFEVAITLPGQTRATVLINPGDFVVADRDGVVIVPRKYAAQVAADAQHVENTEIAQRKLLAAGQEDRKAIYDRFDRFGHIKHINVLR